MPARLRALWRNLTLRNRVDKDLDAELTGAFELLVEEGIGKGLSPAEARRAATLELGRPSSIKTDILQHRSGAGLEQLAQDVKFGARLLRRNPWFAATATLSLAIGIGATTTIFTVVNAVILRELRIPEPRQLIEIGRVTQRGAGFSFSYPAYERFRQHHRVLTGVVAFSRETIEGRIDTSNAAAAGRFVSGNFFDTLGVTARAGRLLSPDDDRIGARHGANVAVISDRFRRREFGPGFAAIGQVVRIGAAQFTVVGILSESFDDLIVGRPADFFIPLAAEALVRHDSQLREASSNWLGLAGRLRPGATVRDAHTALEPILAAILADLSADVPDARAREGIRSQRLVVQSASRGLTDVRTGVSAPVLLLMRAVGFVFLVACVNVMALLMARGVGRRREMSLRLAVGAGHRRLVRQLLTESALLAAAGGAIGLAFAAAGAPWLVRFLSEDAAPLVLDVRPDGRVLIFTASVAAVSALLAGLLPALRTARADITVGLHADARSAAGSRESTRWGQVLVAAQVALTMVLVVGAALLLTTLRNIQRIDPGFDAANVQLLMLDPARVGYTRDRLERYWEEVLARVRSMPGVEAASLSRVTPISGGGIDQRISIDGQPAESGTISANRVSEGFFATISTPLLLGRDFSPEDGRFDRAVVIVNEALARRYFKGGNPLGQRIALSDRRPREIIGIVGNAKYYSLREADAPTAYLLAATSGDSGGLTLAVRTSGPPEASAQAIRARVESVAPAVPISRARTLARQVDRSVGTERLLARLLGTFAVAGLLLACVGLYGVLGYAVARRTGEIGLKLALGATRGGVLRSILREAGLVVTIGAAFGLPAAIVLSGQVGQLLYGVTPANPRVLASATGCVFLVALAAAAVPAWRAARVDPLVALRHE